ncbi:hypothetical protein ACJ41O_001359 [Fusarium nematophilum]
MSRPPTPGSQAPYEDEDFRFKTNSTACEWGEAYHPGGYHPVSLGDIFNSRYQVIRKLGYGSYSTVWLAIDERLQEYVALKIARAETRQDDVDRELSFYQLVKAHHQDLAASRLVGLKDYFQHQGPNGSHPCFVFDPMGPNIDVMLLRCPKFQIGEPWERRFTKQFSKQVARDVILGLSFLHLHDIVHGDIQPGNILVDIPHIDVTLETIKGLEQSPDQGRPLIRLDGKKDIWAPPYLIEGQSLLDYAPTDANPLAKITDLGAAFYESQPPDKILTPVALRSPELILGLKPGKALDIWSFGCLLFELLTGGQLFRVDPLEGEDYDEDINDEHLVQIHEVVAPLPESLLKLWSRGTRYFDADGNRLDPPTDDNKRRAADSDEDTEDQSSVNSGISGSGNDRSGPGNFESLEDRFDKKKPDGVGEAEQRELVQLMRWILQTDPLQRPSAAEILEHPWFSA